MFFIAARFKIKPEYADRWPELARDLTEGTRAEPGSLYFDWARSIDDPDEYVLLSGFTEDDGVREAHYASEHFKRAQAELPAYLQETPRVVITPIESWSELGEFRVG